MVKNCCVVGCRSNVCRDKAISFYRIPKVLKPSRDNSLLSHFRRNRWLSAIKRGLDFSEAQVEHWRVCSKHFITGKPAALEDDDHPDWVPCQNMGYKVGACLKDEQAVARKQRLGKRKAASELQLFVNLEASTSARSTRTTPPSPLSRKLDLDKPKAASEQQLFVNIEASTSTLSTRSKPPSPLARKLDLDKPKAASEQQLFVNLEASTSALSTRTTPPSPLARKLDLDKPKAASEQQLVRFTGGR